MYNMLLSAIASKVLGGGKKPQKRPSVVSCSTHNTVSRSIPRPSICISQPSVFEDIEVVEDTPMSKLIKKIRMLQQLTHQEIEFVSSLDRENILSLFLEYNCSLRFLDVCKYNQKMER